MNVEKIITAMGGRKATMRLLAIRSPAISQMIARKRIGNAQLRFFIALRPELNWAELLNTDYPRFSTLIADQSLRRLRVQHTPAISQSGLSPVIPA
jgi:DNA-binding transcriptional regulator YdaS (Cro superfamily)